VIVLIIKAKFSVLINRAKNCIKKSEILYITSSGFMHI
jgi:hypothetical protein